MSKQYQTEALRKEINSLTERLKTIEQSMKSDRTTLAQQNADKQRSLESLQSSLTNQLGDMDTRFTAKITQVMQHIDNYEERLKSLDTSVSKGVLANERLGNSIKGRAS